MCIFTDEIRRVSATNIFARGLGRRQLLVYGMELASARELAMVLPIPVPPGTGEDEVDFIDLSECNDFFRQLNEGFPGDDMELGALLDAGPTAHLRRTLAVHEVGSFEASFVPTPEDFGRLDERFRLPLELWTQLGRYRDYGFAVFKLKPTEFARVHPMAFEFPRRDAKRLFFPTYHIHSRRIEAHADFDHMLYCQPDPPLNWHLEQWQESEEPAGRFVRCPPVSRLLDVDFPCWRAPIEGSRENRDTWLGPGERLPERAPHGGEAVAAMVTT